MYLERQLTEARRLVVELKSTPRPFELPEGRPQGSPDQLPDNAASYNSNDAAISAPTNTPENHVASIPQGHPTSQQASHLKVIPYNATRVRRCKDTALWREELRCFLINILVAGLWPIKRESSVRMNQYILTELFTDSRFFGLLADKLSPLYLSLFPDPYKIKISQLLAKSLVQFS